VLVPDLEFEILVGSRGTGSLGSFHDAEAEGMLRVDAPRPWPAAQLDPTRRGEGRAQMFSGNCGANNVIRLYSIAGANSIPKAAIPTTATNLIVAEGQREGYDSIRDGLPSKGTIRDEA
jgi:hypothetical protein